MFYWLRNGPNSSPRNIHNALPSSCSFWTWRLHTRLPISSPTFSIGLRSGGMADQSRTFHFFEENSMTISQCVRLLSPAKKTSMLHCLCCCINGATDCGMSSIDSWAVTFLCQTTNLEGKCASQTMTLPLPNMLLKHAIVYVAFIHTLLMLY